MKKAMTLANKITLTRALLAIIMFFMMITQKPILVIIASFIYGFAACTDWVDGRIARATKTYTPFGAIVDPFVDKILVGAAFFAFTDLHFLHVPVWAVFLIILRELMVSTLRVLAALNNKVLAAERWGKFKTTVQLIAIGLIFVIADIYLLVPFFAGSVHKNLCFTSYFLMVFPYPVTVITAVVTCLSAVTYLKNNWELLKESWSLPIK
ncbi:MAG: CDP-diacylglycerol--glycerol-3-phosphate 3-phosphatidyltransferase [Elusimicrobiaceae bacterium]|nr:CDP-diacylglycerol--glycerol-3-phosphate 3-phosphatidyltransferase [Elusimicrobiaceae bacterium]